MQAFQGALASVMVARAAGGEAVRAGLTAAVTAGHDTDTVAAIAGGLIGGSHGVGAIPAEWVAKIEGWPGYRAHDLVGLALAISTGGAARGSWPSIRRMGHPAARPLAAPHPDDPELLIGTLVDLDRAQDLGVEAVRTTTPICMRCSPMQRSSPARGEPLGCGSWSTVSPRTGGR